MVHKYAPLSAEVSAFWPDHLNCLLPGSSIPVSGFYMKEGSPHIVLRHCQWESRAHFKIRWVVDSADSDHCCIALLEQVCPGKSSSRARQIFVRVIDGTAVYLISHPEFMRVLQLVCADIMSYRFFEERDRNRKVIDDVNSIFRKFSSNRLIKPMVSHEALVTPLAWVQLSHHIR